MGLVQQIRRGLDKRRRSEADITYEPYLRPEGSSGLHFVKDPYTGIERVVGSSLAGQTFKPGTIVMLGSNTGFPGQSIIGPPPPGRRGSSGFAIDAPTPGELGVTGITSASPATIESGASAEAVTLTGFGFLPSDTFEAVVFNQATGVWTADPLVTVATTSVPDSETASVTVTVDSAVPDGREISFRVRSTVGVELMTVISATSAPGSYWGIFYDAGAQELHCWLYDENGQFVEVVDVQSADLTGTRNAPSWASYCIPMHLNGDAIEWPYSIDVSPFTRSGFRWLPLSATLDQFASTIDPDSESSADWHGRHSGCRVGDRFFLSQNTNFNTAGNLSWTSVLPSSSLRGRKTIDMSSFGFSSLELQRDTGFAAGWVPSGDSIIIEISDESGRGLLIIDTETKATNLIQPFTAVDSFDHTPSPSIRSPGIDLGSGVGAFLTALSSGGWVAVLRHLDGSPDIQHWQAVGLSISLTAGLPQIRRVPGSSIVAAYPFTTGKLIRTDTAEGAGVNPSDNEITVEVGPNGSRPHIMLPRS